MRVLVTGAGGFTGSNLCERLSTEGYQVRALVRRGSPCDFLEKMKVEIFPGDLCDPESLYQSTKDVDTVYHIAALFRQQGPDRKMFWRINVEGVRHLLEASVKNGVRRFVHCSTMGVHGHISQIPATEETPYNPGDIYQETKLEGEKIAQQFMNEKKLPVTIFRPTAIYGPGDLRLLKLFLAIKNRRFMMIGDGKVYFHMVYIDDLIKGIIQCGTQDRAIGQTYILGGEHYVTLNQLMPMIADELNVPHPQWRIPHWPVHMAGLICEMVCKPLGIEPPLYRRRVDFFSKSRGFDISKAKNEIGYSPEIDLKEGIRKTVHWYRGNGYL